jgi:enoyl-CoA hydratase/carnithine racemase
LTSGGTGYLYEKSLHLVPGKPQLVITHRLRNTGTTAINTSVYDHNFFDREVDMVPLLEELANVQLPWWCFARSDALLNLSERSWALVRKSRLRMAYIGAESPSDWLLHDVRKGTRPDQTLAAVELCRSNGVIPELSFMLAPPQDPEGDTERTFAYIRHIKRIHPKTEVMIYIYAPLPPPPGEAHRAVVRGISELRDAEGAALAFPATVEQWAQPQWQAYWCHTDVPWLTERLRSRIRDFTTVLGCRFPTLTDIRSPSWGKSTLRALASLMTVDGVLCVEFHAKMNAIDADITAMLAAAVEEGRQNWRAIVIGNEAPDFCVGANLFLVLMGAKSGAWDEIERGVRALQDVNMALKYSDTPVVVAPTGRTLGGGAEIVMHGQAVRAAVETYIGLVEVAAGVVPAGGGCKELLARWQTLAPEYGPFSAPRHAFETIAVATVATSAYDAMSYGFLRKDDAVTWDRERLQADAKADALVLAEAKDKGTWRKPEPPTFRLPGPGGRLVLEQVAEGLKLQGKASEHDVVVSSHLAYVLTGGNCSPLDILSEQDILDLEREAFIELCKFEKTQERMAALLTTGKPLRN